MRPMPRTVRPAAITVGRRPDMAWIAVTVGMATVPPLDLGRGRDATGSAQPAIGEHAAPAPDIPARVPHQVCGVPALVARRTGPGMVDAARGAAPHRDASGTARCHG